MDAVAAVRAEGFNYVSLVKGGVSVADFRKATTGEDKKI